jgi:drug/metabolite transporter (DMT)-like permease
MQAAGFIILSVLGTAAFTLVLRGTVAAWPIGLAGSFSRVVTLALLGGWVLATGSGWRRLRSGGLGKPLLLMGAVSIAINLLWFAALRLTTATNVAMLLCLDLVFVVLIGGLLGLERIGWRQLALLPAMLAGMALLIGAGGKGWGGHLAGDLMAVAAALAYAANAFIIRGILRTMDEEAVSLYNHGISTLGFIALVLLGGEFRTAAAVLRQPAAWLWIVALGLTAALSLPLYYAALRRTAVWKLRAWTLTAPVLVAVVEWLCWGVHLDFSQCVGAAMVLGSLAVLARIESRTLLTGQPSSQETAVVPGPAAAAAGAAPCYPDLS